MPVTPAPSKYKGAYSHLVPHHVRKGLKDYRKTIKGFKDKGYEYGDILDMVKDDKDMRQFMLKMHQLALIIWMVDNDRMTWEQFQTAFPEVSPLALLGE